MYNVQLYLSFTTGQLIIEETHRQDTKTESNFRPQMEGEGDESNSEDTFGILVSLFGDS